MAKLDKQHILQARAFLQSANWPELLAHCRQKENPNTEILILRLTSACMLDNDSEVSTTIRLFEPLDAKDLFYSAPRYLTKFVCVLETAHRFEQAGAALLHGGDRLNWISLQYNLAERIARKIQGASKVKRRLHQRVVEGLNLVKKSEIIFSPSRFTFPLFDPKTASGFANPSAHSFVVTASTGELAPTLSRFYQFRTKFLPRLEPKAPEVIPQFEDVYSNLIGQIWTKEGKALKAYGRPIPEKDLKTTSLTEVEDGGALLYGVKGVYHWLAEMLPSVSWLTRPEAVQAKVVVPAEIPQFKLDSLRLAGIRQEQIVPLKTAVCSFNRLHYPGYWQKSIFYSVSFFETMIANARVEATLPLEPRLLYITRRDSNRRVMENEGELERELVNRGFTIAELSKLSLADQITLFANATVVVAPHGAGLTHIMFAKPGTNIFEIVPSFNGMPDRMIHLRFNYARLSMMKGFQYRAFLQECHPVKNAWTVDLPGLLTQLDTTLI